MEFRLTEEGMILRKWAEEMVSLMRRTKEGITSSSGNAEHVLDYLDKGLRSFPKRQEHS